MTGRPYGWHRDWLDAECWCGCEIVVVHRTEVRALRTGTCGRPWCRQPEGGVAR